MKGRSVVYVHPGIGSPDEPSLPGWDEIPGLRGCTAQSCAFRDQQSVFERLGADVYGLSTQSPREQRDAARRLHLPYELLSDQHRIFIRALGLPEVEVAGRLFARRLTLILLNGSVEHVFYPVHEPEMNAGEVIGWLQSRS